MYTTNEVEFIKRYVAASIAAKQCMVEQCAAAVAAGARVIAESMQRGGKLLLCGNGGSAADCQHIAAEFVSVLNQSFLRPGLPAIALTTDTSILTASANDFGFEGIFARQVQALGRPGDVVIGISTSGKSENVFRALKYGHENQIHTITLTGRSYDRFAPVTHIPIAVPSETTQYIQECHIAIGHMLCALAEQQIFRKATDQKQEEEEGAFCQVLG